MADRDSLVRLRDAASLRCNEAGRGGAALVQQQQDLTEEAAQMVVNGSLRHSGWGTRLAV